MNIANPSGLEIFFSEDWLSPLCNSFEFIQIEHKESKLIVAICAKQKFLFELGECPPFTPFNAIIVHPCKEINLSNKFNIELALYHKLLEYPLKYEAIQLKFSEKFLSLPRISDGRLSCKLAFTEVLEAPISTEDHWNTLSSEIRNDIQFARNNAEVSEVYFSTEISDFLLSNNYYKSVGLSHDALFRLFASFSHLGNMKIFTVNVKNKIVSCSVFVKSGETWYYWLNSNQKDRNVRGMHLALIWEGINLAALTNCNFNFDGSKIEELAKVFKSFGSKTIVYPNNYFIKSSCLRFANRFRPI